MSKYILSNEDRKYLGLTPIDIRWEIIKIKHIPLFFDRNIIRKMIRHSEFLAEDFTYFDMNVFDLRSPKNKKDKEEIFQLFGLDTNLDYEGNLKL